MEDPDLDDVEVPLDDTEIPEDELTEVENDFSEEGDIEDASQDGDGEEEDDYNS